MKDASTKSMDLPGHFAFCHLPLTGGQGLTEVITMQDPLMEQGIELMLYGMGTVFVFLTLLVLVTTLMSALFERFGTPDPVPAATPAARPVSPAADDKQLIAVISAAIHKYRSRHK